MKPSGQLSQTSNLRGAAAVTFALTALLPLLLFVAFLWRRELIEETETQLVVALALLIAVLGFAFFREITGRVTALARLARDMTPEATSVLATETRAATVSGLGRMGATRRASLPTCNGSHARSLASVAIRRCGHVIDHDVRVVRCPGVRRTLGTSSLY